MAKERVKVKGRIVYADLFAPRAFDEHDSKPKYGVTVLIYDNDVCVGLEEKENKMLQETFTQAQVRSAKDLLKDGNLDYDHDQFKDAAVVTARSIYAPDVIKRVDGKMTAADPEDVHDGMWAWVSLNLYTYDNKNRGVAAGLGNVCLLPELEYEEIAGGRVSAFEEFGDCE